MMNDYLGLTTRFNQFTFSNNAQRERMWDNMKSAADHFIRFSAYEEAMRSYGARSTEMQARVLDLAFDIACYAPVQTTDLALFSTLPENQINAEQYVNDTFGCDVIHTTPAGYMLERMELFNKNVHLVDSDIAYLPWDILAARLAKETTANNVTAFISSAKTCGTFMSVELPLLLENSHVERINGQPKDHFGYLSQDYARDMYEEVRQHGFDPSILAQSPNPLAQKRGSLVVDDAKAFDINPADRQKLWERTADIMDSLYLGIPLDCS